MIKKLGGFILILLSIGIGLSLYLPEYPMVEVPAAEFVLLKESLDKPINANLLRNSLTIFDDATAHALQLGVFATLANAGKYAAQINQQGLPLPLSIFKTHDSQRQWYVLALGPLVTKEESIQYQQLLLDNNVQSQPISWPITEKAKE
ncbi:hypothetical protein AB835_12360 [Candidatus Endobugula sertula]|uniref:SPOR domain-containing protein n=1 Tax=Candidatus Endobugula sertula TaxID=62101 RepID=A0A1D2QMH8_9GAMM|nr:hypothetical protein AB835_12360 [Candidatus Endobugula sertula]